MREWITTAQAASIIGVKQKRVLKWIHSGQLPADVFGKMWILKMSDVAYFRDHRPRLRRPMFPDELDAD